MLSKRAIRKLSRRAGVVPLETCYPEMACVLEEALRHFVRLVIVPAARVAERSGRRTVVPFDIAVALRGLPRTY